MPPSPGSPVAACFGAMPADWARALHARSVTTAAGVSFLPGGVAGNATMGEFVSAAGSGIGRLDMTTGGLTTLSRLPAGSGGTGAMAVAPPWMVWEELDSKTNLNDWTIHAWNLTEGVGKQLATSRLGNGTYVTGQQPLPVVRDGVTAWAQPLPTAGGVNVAQIRTVDLATGATSTISTGRVSSPVFAGPYLVWGEIDSAGHYLIRLVTAAGFKPVATPAPLSNPGPMLYFAGSPQYLAWSSGDLNSLTVWPIGTDRLLHFTQSNPGHPFQFLQLAGHFLLWYTGNGSSVLDLNTGNAFDVSGSVAASADTIAIAEKTLQPPKGTYAANRVSTLAVSAMPSIRGCAKPSSGRPSPTVAQAAGPQWVPPGGAGDEGAPG